MTPVDDSVDTPFEADGRLTSPPSPTRPYYWSVRRELWEHRSIYVAPLAVAGLILFGFLISAFNFSSHVEFTAKGPLAAVSAPYDIAAISIIFTAGVVGVFYTLGALHGERRDRTILFWKSLPVSDLTTVLTKASIPLVILPIIVFTTVVATQIVMLGASAAVLTADGRSIAPVWTQLHLFQSWVILLYSLVALSLWYAPIYGWFLVVSGWSRRSPLLWAILPPLGLCVLEKIAFSTSYAATLIKYRLGGFTTAFTPNALSDSQQARNSVDPLSVLDPVGFLNTPGLWVGLGFATAFLAAAIWLRRRREAI
jgi:ABC-2 type transport system permease protein